MLKMKLLQEILLDSTGATLLLLQKTPIDEQRVQIALFRLDPQGEKISGRQRIVKKHKRFQMRGKPGVLDIFELIDQEPGSRQQSLLLRSTGNQPLKILRHHNYLGWKTIFNRVQIDSQLESPATETQ